MTKDEAIVELMGLVNTWVKQHPNVRMGSYYWHLKKYTKDKLAEIKKETE